MARRTWTFDLDGKQHVIELEHDTTTGKRAIYVDGEIREQSQHVVDYGSRHPFQIEGHEVVVVIEPGLRFRCDLLVDGHSLGAGEQVPERVEFSQAATDQDTAVLRCERCGREGVPAIFTCPKRPSGDCPYVEQWRKKKLWWSQVISLVLLVISLVLLFVSACAIIAVANRGLMPLVVIAALIFLAFVFISPIFLAFVFISPIEVVQLYNANSGVWLQRRTLWGREQSYEWVERSEQVPIDLKLPRSLAYPPSVAALPPDLRKVTREEAAAIVRAALVGLLAQGRIQIYHYRLKRLGRGSVLKLSWDRHAVVGTRELDQAQLEGKLERQIRRILTDWSKQKVVDKRSDGPPIYDLVRSLYGSDKDAPAKWLARFVAYDAATQGWGQHIGTLMKSFEWDDVHASQLQREREVIRGLSSQLLQSNPDFSHEMDREIAQGIESRERLMGE